jgi:hypothetical protein
MRDYKIARPAELPLLRAFQEYGTALSKSSDDICLMPLASARCTQKPFFPLKYL